jgi:hypothetical protein
VLKTSIWQMKDSILASICAKELYRICMSLWSTNKKLKKNHREMEKKDISRLNDYQIVKEN